MGLTEELECIGKKIKLLRIAKGIRQFDVAQAINISPAHLSNIERGRNSITLENLFKLRELLGCNVSEFFSELDSQAKKEIELTAEEMQVMLKMFKKMVEK